MKHHASCVGQTPEQAEAGTARYGSGRRTCAADGCDLTWTWYQKRTDSVYCCPSCRVRAKRLSSSAAVTAAFAAVS